MPKIPLSELAGAIGARLEGDPAFEVSGIAPLERAGPEDLSFLANPRYEAAAMASAAGALVTGQDFPANGRNILRCENPYLGFARAVAMLSPDPPVVAGVHPTAVVDPSASIPSSAAVGPLVVVGSGVELGEAVVIGAGSHLEDGVRIGTGTRLFPRVTVHRGTRLGERCVVQSGCVLGSDGFGYATDVDGVHHRVPQRGGLTIGNDVELGANVTIDRGSAGDTVIGHGCKIDNLVHIAHNVRIGRNTMIVAQVGIAGSTVIGDRAVLGGQAGITGHVRIGDRARVGAQAGVIGDVPAGME
ncbi:MAG TPA: UDP-3-O-(3-hydroxymyristoyl)glucosamine N-acyltransferase, partial [Gemmatimonadota bacterium]|nr:UDP-3-O-(3-hydroxymyristoyl)glucosamine N-acyltransferase [Gemmatimonadota bacterium]